MLNGFIFILRTLGRQEVVKTSCLSEKHRSQRPRLKQNNNTCRAQRPSANVETGKHLE